ncbi:MAG TPA: GNAT family N-acetyltransferase [Candidatus Bathyarchaeia archaeon]|jgi:ribosomal protein S18 acetylase RimI-like enzyme|nr:GNAT family N-acetyltransferase [Candidatus Bathyarchaeia archaeon]
MVTISDARVSDRKEIEQLVSEYHASENLVPVKERIAWAIDLQLRRKSPGLLLAARDRDRIIGLALAVLTPSAELGRVLTVNDFFVRPDQRRRGVGRQLVEELVERSKTLKVDLISLEVLHENAIAASFWRAMGFKPADRYLFTRNLG